MDVVDSVATSLAIPDNLSPAQRRDIVRNYSKTLGRVDDVVHLIVAEFLHETKDQEYFRDWGFKSFDDYCDAELDFSSRKARHLVTIFEKFHIECGLPKEEIQKCTWTKLSILKRVATPGNARALIDKAKTQTVREIQDDVRKRVANEKGTDVFKSMTFSLTSDQYEMVSTALEAAKRISGSEKTGNLLDLIATDFLASNVGQGIIDEQVTLDKLVHGLERVFGVRIEVLKEAAP